MKWVLSASYTNSHIFFCHDVEKTSLWPGGCDFDLLIRSSAQLCSETCISKMWSVFTLNNHYVSILFSVLEN